MVKYRTIIILFFCITLTADHDIYSAAGKKGVSRHRPAKSHRVNRKKETPRQPDPALEWGDCGGNSIAGIFNNNITSTRIAPVKGDIADVAVRGEKLYVLVKNFNLVSDAIFTIRKQTGRIETIWGIGRLGAEAIACDDRFIWILSRSERYFIRKLTMAGKSAGAIGISSFPEGSFRGLSVSGGVLSFAVRRGNGSGLFIFDPKTRGLKEIGSYRGEIGGVASHQGFVLAYLNEFDAYSDHWLLAFDNSGELKRKMRFVDAVPDALTGDGKDLYCMIQGKDGATVFPVAVLMDRSLVLAAPTVRTITMTIPVTGTGSIPCSVDLWVPYPIHRRFQNVRRVSLDPKPAEITDDRFGNRWARVRFERVTGSVRAILTFDVITAAVAYTLEQGADLSTDDLAPESAFLGETSAFDISHFIIKSHSTRIDGNGSCLSRVLAIRDYVNETIRFTAYCDRWMKASDYLFRGRGDAYGQTLGFAALSRFMGIPARAAGGLIIDASTEEGERDPVATWNQVYMPGPGWVDIGIGRDYGEARDVVAGKPAGYCVMFEGDFDCSDYRNAFAEAGWTLAYRLTCSEKNHGADISVGTVRVAAKVPEK